MSRRRESRKRTLSRQGARVLKWVGAITAVISLVLGVRQLTTWMGDSMHRRREAAVQIDLARQQASRGAFADAWSSLDRADRVRPGEEVDAARVEVAFAWLQEAHPGPGRPFKDITDPAVPALDRALLGARGQQRADLLAHLGWATFLRWRDGARGDPAARYHEALAVDPSNAYANAMLGHWLLWTGSDVAAARERFATALSAAGDRRPFVRRLQLAALSNRSGAADAELVRVADDMRRRGETLDPAIANRVFHVFRFRYRTGTAPEDDLGIAAADVEATYEWVVKASTAAGQSSEVDALRQRVRAALHRSQ